MKKSSEPKITTVKSKTTKSVTKNESKKNSTTKKTTIKNESKKSAIKKDEEKLTIKSKTKKEQEKASTTKKTSVKSETKKNIIIEEEKKTTKRKYVRKDYYMFKMNSYFLNGFSLILIILAAAFFYLLYGNKSLEILSNNINVVMIIYIPYLILHEQLHSLGYVIYGADFKNITFGAHLEKGILCCLCKQNIEKNNIIHSLLFPFIFIGVVTLIIGILVNYPVLVILSLTNIAGCSGDLLMYYHLRKLDDFAFSEYNDPMAFALYTKQDFSNLKMLGLDYVGKKTRIERNDLRRVVVSKPSIIILLIFYALMISVLFI